MDGQQSHRFIWSMVAAQVMVQIGAFTLPALLPDYIDRWHLTKTEAGCLIGVFFAAYVVAVPALVRSRIEYRRGGFMPWVQASRRCRIWDLRLSPTGSGRP